MDRGHITINKNYELEYRYYDKDTNYKYFNRKFEVILLEKKSLKKKYVLSMDNSDTGNMKPFVYKANINRRYDFGVTTLNWNDIKNNFMDFLIAEIGENQRNHIKKAIGKLTSPKL
jgi:hypothetical protein